MLHPVDVQRLTRRVEADECDPAMAAGVTDRLWDINDLADLIEGVAPKPVPRSAYKKRIAA
jgi:hypothetical protein